MALTRTTAVAKFTAANDALGENARIAGLVVTSGATGGVVTVTTGDANGVIYSKTLGTNSQDVITFGDGLRVPNVQVTAMPATCTVYVLIKE